MTREDLTAWFLEHGYPGAQPGNHITARAQEQLLQRGSQVDARVSLLESVFVIVAIHLGGRSSGQIPQSERVPATLTFGQVQPTTCQDQGQPN